MEELEGMHDVCVYHIQVRGHVDETAFNAASPLRVTVVQEDPDAVLSTVCSDQSGLVGLIRHLHGHGFVILSVYRDR
jgi:hypothetical protein